MKVKNRKGWSVLGRLILSFMLLCICKTRVEAATAYDIDIIVQYQQTEARTMYEMINDFRTGDSAWYWNEDNATKTQVTGLSELNYDYDLEKVAMLRAAELALTYAGHIRPNNQPLQEAYEQINSGFYNTWMGENIGAIYGTSLPDAERIFTAWREDDCDYAGQGHRRNMLSKNYTAVGIGCVYYNGCYYWAQEFSSATVNTTQTAANDSKVQETIRVADSKITNVQVKPSSISLLCGQSVDLSEYKIYVTLAGTFPSGNLQPTELPVTWSASNRYVTLSGNTITGSTQGTSTLSCSALGESLSIDVTIKHNWDSGKMITPQTCTQAGFLQFTCKGCGCTQGGTVVAKGHTWDGGKVTTAATCTTAGEKIYQCTDCEATKTEAISKKGHIIVRDYAVKETCITAGRTEGSHCAACNMVIIAQQTIDATGHNWTYGTVSISPTCTSTGIRKSMCINCGSSKSITVPAKGHSWDTGSILYQPTTTSTGAKIYDCITCGSRKYEEIPKLEEENTSEPIQTASIQTAGIMLTEYGGECVKGGLVVEMTGNADLEYRWQIYDYANGSWSVWQDWTTNNEWFSWYPPKVGNYLIHGEVRISGTENVVASTIGYENTYSAPVESNIYIKGKCQMPYYGAGGGYLIGVETNDNPGQNLRYELLILDCTLLEQGKPAWIWTTGKCGVSEGNAFWAVWQPEYGYYWTLFRVYDQNDNLLAEECYGFANAY